jgi:hypothetical protein
MRWAWLWLALGGCDWVLECSIEGGCEPFVPEGTLCGLVDDPSRFEQDDDPSYNLYRAECTQGARCASAHPGDLHSPDPTAVCPRGFGPYGTRDREAPSSGEWHGCAAEGNAARSSTDLSELPQGVACGIGTSWPAQPSVLCMGADPGRAECPEGMELHYALDIAYDRPQSIGDRPGTCERPPELHFITSVDTVGYGHVRTWCAVTHGCTDCRWDESFLCGLHGTQSVLAHRPPSAEGDRYGESFWAHLQWQELNAELCDRLHQDYAAWRADELGWRASEPRCRGVAVIPYGCPDGLALTCTRDWIGSERKAYDEPAEALCWCARPDEVLDPPQADCPTVLLD